MRDHQPDIIREAIRRGWDPANLTDEQNRTCALAVRTRLEVVQDAGALLASTMRTSAGLVVLPQIRDQNQKTCEENKCGKFRRLRSGEPACDWCNCQGDGLRSKWEDILGYCPGGYWSNLK